MLPRFKLKNVYARLLRGEYGIITAVSKETVRSNMEAKELAEKVVEALTDAKGEDVRLYDVRGKSQFTDFFVVATGAAAPHLKALASAAQSALQAAGEKAHKPGGDPEGGWIVADYIDIVVHIFSKEARAYYALERIWQQ